MNLRGSEQLKSGILPECSVLVPSSCLIGIEKKNWGNKKRPPPPRWTTPENFQFFCVAQVESLCRWIASMISIVSNTHHQGHVLST